MPAHFYHLFSLLLYKVAWVLSAKVLVSHQLDKHLLMHLPPEYWIELGRVSHVDYATPKFLLYSICKIGTNFRFFFENHTGCSMAKRQKLNPCHNQLWWWIIFMAWKIFLKFIYSEKVARFCEISTLLLTGTTYSLMH